MMSKHFDYSLDELIPIWKKWLMNYSRYFLNGMKYCFLQVQNTSYSSDIAPWDFPSSLNVDKVDRRVFKYTENIDEKKFDKNIETESLTFFQICEIWMNTYA